MTPENLLEDLRRFGDRTSSFMTTYPGFKSYVASDGQVRFMETPRAWVAGTEPLAAAEKRAGVFRQFEEESRRHGKRAIMLPVAESLSLHLESQGFGRIQIGSEPVFDLEEYFGRERDPLDRFPHARSLFRRGARVTELTRAELDGPRQTLKQQLEEMTSRWLEVRKTVPLHFLNQVDPWRLVSERKIFVLEHGSRVLAFLSAVPIFPRGGFFYADYIRRPDSKAGTVELLFIESMRQLKAQGYLEVSLGACPLAGIESARAKTARERLALRALSWVFEKARFPYRFKSVYEFKAKLQPTRWEPLYLVARDPVSLSSLRALSSVHFPGGILSAWAKGVRRMLPGLLRAEVRLRPWPRTLAEALARVRVSLGFGVLFLALHLARVTLPAVQWFFENYGFSAANFTWTGWFAGPLFHNNAYHLGGDLLSFWVFGMVLECAAGSRLFLAVMAAGLWLTNPISWGVLHFPLSQWNPQGFARLMGEVDYGSSNAVYAFVGALAAWLRDSRLLIMPFALNGFFLCLARESWLSIHHLVGLWAGYAIGRLWLRWLESRCNSHEVA